MVKQIQKLDIPKTISFSHMNDLNKCGHYYFLTNIKKLRKFSQTIYTIYGKLIHQSVQNILMKNFDPTEVSKRLDRIWTKFCGIYKKYLPKDLDFNPIDMKIPATKVIQIIKQEFIKQFGNFKVLCVEEWLRSNCDPRFSQQFVGCIDIVIKLDNGKIIILDFKSCDNNYKFVKYMDKYKEYQLVLYKDFYCKKYNIVPQDIETYFITLERNIGSKNPLNFLRVTSGAVKIKNATEWLCSSLERINLGIFLKNRSSCFKYGEEHVCPFYDTEYCIK